VIRRMVCCFRTLKRELKVLEIVKRETVEVQYSPDAEFNPIYRVRQRRPLMEILLPVRVNSTGWGRERVPYLGVPSVLSHSGCIFRTGESASVSLGRGKPVGTIK
jgi:hypothetical protein